MVKEIVLKGRKGTGGKAEGKALVSKKVICWYTTFDIDGNVVDKESELFGQNISGSILVYPAFKGSTVGSITLYEMAMRGSAPKALINTTADSVTLSGAILGDIPVIHQFDVDPTTVIETGDTVSVDGKSGTVKIFRE
jgi:predicted aconitase with swiveling domain